MGVAAMAVVQNHPTLPRVAGLAAGARHPVSPITTSSAKEAAALGVGDTRCGVTKRCTRLGLVGFVGCRGRVWRRQFRFLGLIALYSSYDHINLGFFKTRLNRQWGFVCIIISLAVAAVVAAGFCEAVAQLATRSRRREGYRRIQDARTAAQLEQALIKLSSLEVQAFYDDEVLERLVGLR